MTTLTARAVIEALLAAPYPHDLLRIRARVADYWGGDEKEAKKHMVVYCTEAFALAERERYQEARLSAARFLDELPD